MARNLQVVLCYFTSLPGVEEKDFLPGRMGSLCFGVVWQQSQDGESSGVALVPSQRGKHGCGLVGLGQAFWMSITLSLACFWY